MKKAYDQGALMMLGDVVARIGCAAAMPKDHKNEWLQNRFSLNPAGRMKIPGMKGTHLVWREADVEKAKRMWEAANQKDEMPGHYFGERKPSIAAELKEIGFETPEWKTPDAGTDLAHSMIDLAMQLLHQAKAMLKAGAA